MQELVRRDLHCPSEVEGEERCTTQAALRAPSSESPALREVAVLTIARGESGFETTHLLLHLEDGWWLGPQLGDGPFNGNQMSGTLAFRVTEVSIETAFEGEPALVAHYESETSNEIDEQQHDVREAGLILCINLASDQLRCARVAESIHHEVDGELTEARARLRIVGDGTIAVDEVSGSHERVPREVVYIEQLYQ